ncbi:hypothetical protein FHX81_5975 [Saccharothrix saharensis]|uniref:Transcriptional regulator with AbiEi antitoxin domain of type IV toxin-antitoxin system n=1 Tax=Saccharothrix saharensis TaxID=571190 RepID=A0A543JL44_9PSEU|nr:hypothetical protein [Saccharothrix saharensis]TQM83549.1 hypothetical protein FHX81_5975 [Saccharothrix saharensis]
MRTTNRTTIDLDALGGLFPQRVATASELLALGLPSAELALRCRPQGPWQHLLPGILLLSRTPPSRAQLVRAALRYGGPQTLLTGVDALQLHGLRALPATGPVQILVNRPLEPAAKVRITRIRHLPDPVLRRGFLTAPLARAAVDTARVLRLPDDIRAVLTEVVRHGGVPVGDLRRGLARASDQARQVISELADGVRSAPQAWARAVLDDLPLPPPAWGVPLVDAEGRHLGIADAWWDDRALAWQFTTPTPHRGMLTAAGAVVLHTTPVRLRRSPTSVAQDLLTAAARAATRPKPRITPTHRLPRPFPPHC